MHATQGKTKTYIEVWYTNSEGRKVHLASLQIGQSRLQSDVDATRRNFEEVGLESLSEPTRKYLESFLKNEYDLTYELKTVG